MSTLNQFSLHWEDGADRELSVAFNRQTRCVCAMFARFFGKYRGLEFWKVGVMGRSEITRSEPFHVLGVCTVQIQPDFTEFFAGDDLRKKTLALEWLWQGLQKVISHYGLDPRQFKSAYQHVKDAHYRNHWYWSPKKSPSRKMTAMLECIHDLNCFQAFLLITDKSGQPLLRKPAFKDLPSEFSFIKHFGKLVWSDKDHVVYRNRAGEVLLDEKIVLN